MADLLKTVAVFLLLVAGLTAGCVALVVRALNRANRVSRGHKSAAPATWLVSLGTAARLHRRLRRAVDTAGAVVTTLVPAALPLRDVAADLTQRAVLVDDWLVAAHGLHTEAHRIRMAELAQEVRQIEVSAARLHSLGSEWRRSIERSAALVPAPDLHLRLDAVEAALRELPIPSVTPVHLPG